MPHLSPLNWMLSPIIFWLILIIFISSMWWSQSLQLPKLSASLMTPNNTNWPW